jgi:FkbM family methyltransferase
MLADKINNLLPVVFRRWQTKLWFLLWKPQTRRVFKNFVKKGDLVFDIGANFGDLTECFLKSGARVICVEPQKYCADELKKKFSKNSKVVIVNKGVGETTSRKTFYVSTRNRETSTFSKSFMKRSRFNNRLWDQSYEVEITTLNKLISQFGLPVFCKIDTEGFEWPIIKALSQKIPYLSFETNLEQIRDTLRCVDHLDSLGGASFNFSPVSTYLFISSEWLNAKDFKKRLKWILPRVVCGDLYVRTK